MENSFKKIHNGNYDIFISLKDGTKIRKNGENCFIPEKPESLDYKITNQCSMGCKFCHEASTPDGKHGDIMHDKFIETLNPYTEVAIGGGNPLAHPDLIPFLKKCKRLNLLPNMTVNQVHFMKEQALIRSLVQENLIYGLGISLVDANKNFLDTVKQYPNAVIHLINGVHSISDYQKLYDQNLKILILGYKQFRRGKIFYNEDVEFEKERTYVFLPEIIKHFAVVSFDNLALDQLKVKDLLTPQQWEEFYMGGDGLFTCFIDSVNQTYSTSSTSPLNERFPLKDDIKEMFQHIRSLNEAAA